MMFKTGLCSVTFRSLSVEEVIGLAVTVGLDGIEWGGDVHVPAGNFEQASAVAKLTKKADLEVISYGSYYRVGESKNNDVSFEQILETAVYLKAPAIRVWAGGLGSMEADRTYRDEVVADAREIATLAAQKNITIHFEYHGETLTDTKESATLLMEEIDHENVKIYWQPAVGISVNERLESIQKVLPWLSHVHVFHWDIIDRLALVEGKEEWRTYLNRLQTAEQTRYLMIEFVKEDSKEQFLEDAGVLKELVSEFNK